MADDRFKDAKLFRSGLEAAIAVSPSGYIGAVINLQKPEVLNIKDIKAFKVFSNDLCIASSDANDGGMVFSNASAKAEAGLQKKTKMIRLELRQSGENQLTTIALWIYRRGRRSSPAESIVDESALNEIKQLLLTLEDVEKSVKKS
jgi:hypothetical protein